MRKLLAGLVGATLAGAVAFFIFGAGLFSNEAGGITIDDVDSFQLPQGGSWNGRICQDLAWDGTYLWVINSDTLPSEDPEILKVYYDEGEGMGEIVGSFDIPESDPELQKGLAWDGTYLLTAWGQYPEGRVYQIDPASPGSASYVVLDNIAMPYGLAYESSIVSAGYLWTVSNVNNYVYRVSRDGNSIISSFSISSDLGNDRKPGGLTYDADNGYVWIAGFGKSDKLYCYTTAGSLVGSISAQTNRPHPIGVTWDATGEYLWYVDACTDTFYRISLLFE